MSTTQEKHFVPTRGQKLMATIEEAFGKMFNNQSRILESRTTRTGVPYGPGGTVAPPASFFNSQPPNIGRSDGLRPVTSSASSNTFVSQAGASGGRSGAGAGESKAVHRVETGMGGGHHGGMQGSHSGMRNKIGGK